MTCPGQSQDHACGTRWAALPTAETPGVMSPAAAARCSRLLCVLRVRSSLVGVASASGLKSLGAPCHLEVAKAGRGSGRPPSSPGQVPLSPPTPTPGSASFFEQGASVCPASGGDEGPRRGRSEKHLEY